MTFFIALFILLMQFLWKYIDDLVGKGFEWYIIAKLLFYASSTFIPLALPLAVLLSSIMTLGNLGEHYELVSIKSAGMSLQKFMRPLVIIAVLISLTAFYFSNNVLPVANLKMKSLLYDVRKQKPSLNIEEGIFYYGIEDKVIKIGKKEKDGKTIHDIIIYDHEDRSRNTTVTVAEWGKMEAAKDQMYLIFSLYNGCNYETKLDSKNASQTRPFQRTYFKKEVLRFDLSGFQLERTKEELFKSHYKMLNIEQLEYYIDSLQNVYKERREKLYMDMLKRFKFLSRVDSSKSNILDTIEPLDANFINNVKNKRTKSYVIKEALKRARSNKDKVYYASKDFSSRDEYIRKYRIEWHRKFTLSIACLILFFIGAPLGAIIRKGGFGLPIVMSIIFFVIYHVVSMTSEKAAREGAIDPYFGMWIASIVYLPLGVFLSYKATTDSSLFDIAVYNKYISKIMFWKKKNKKVEDPSNNK